jgi:hypothetical protein
MPNRCPQYTEWTQKGAGQRLSRKISTVCADSLDKILNGGFA